MITTLKYDYEKTQNCTIYYHSGGGGQTSPEHGFRFTHFWYTVRVKSRFSSAVLVLRNRLLSAFAEMV